MKKYLFLFIPIFTLIGLLTTQSVYADRDDEANKYYLEAYNSYKLGKLDQSLEMLRKVTEINPEHAEAHFGMGSIYFRQNMFDDAVKEFTKVTRIKPEYVEAYQRLWLAYKKLGMNDKAEEELQKYKKLIEERMQNMAGASTHVVKPVAPPQREETVEKPKPEVSHPQETKVETSHTVETKPPETAAHDTKVTEPRHSGIETGMGSSVPVRPVPPAPAPVLEERSHLTTETRSPVPETVPAEKRPAAPQNLHPEAKSVTKPETEDTSPYIKVDKKDPAYKNLFKPFKKMGSALFHSPLKKSTEGWKRAYFGKLLKGIFYYIVSIQLWLCVVAFLGIYFFKSKRKSL